MYNSTKRLTLLDFLLNLDAHNALVSDLLLDVRPKKGHYDGSALWAGKYGTKRLGIIEPILNLQNGLHMENKLNI